MLARFCEVLTASFVIVGIQTATAITVARDSVRDVPKSTILAALEANYSRIDGIICSFEMRVETTKAGEDVLRSVQALKSSKGPRQYDKVVWSTKPHANMIRYTTEVRDEGTDKVVETRLASFDGTRGYSYSDRGTDATRAATIQSRPSSLGEQVTALSMLSGVHVYLFDLPLYRVLATADSLVLEERVRTGGSECFRLVATGCKYSASSRYRFSVEVDPTLGFGVRSIEMSNENRPGERTTFVCEEFKEHRFGDAEKLSFPSQVRVEYWHPSQPNPALITQIRVNELNLAAQLTKKDFEFEFPVGTIVQDNDTRKNFIAGDRNDELVRLRAEQALDELNKSTQQERSDRASRPTYSYTLSLVAFATAGAAFALLVWLKRH